MGGGRMTYLAETCPGWDGRLNKMRYVVDFWHNQIWRTFMNKKAVGHTVLT